MSAKPDIGRIIDLHRLLLQFQAVQRVVHVPGSLRQENDTEHSYNLTMTAWYLCGHFPHLDRNKVICYALAHDFVEVHAGDTNVFADQDALDSKQAREAQALKRLEAEWPDFLELTETIHAYEARSDEEARFVYALDKLMPIIVIFLAEGHTWQKEGISPEALWRVKRDKVKLSPDIQYYYEQLYQVVEQHRHYFTGTNADSAASRNTIPTKTNRPKAHPLDKPDIVQDPLFTANR